ncbi:MAG: NAD(P)/FAD-dependent oxidoreductase [Betaproteobacteria bacterium]
MLAAIRRAGFVMPGSEGSVNYDIIVVGAGPAGLSAAARAGWLAAPGATYKARILVLDAGDKPGGLARWQPLVINTPGVFFTKRELKALLNTCENFGVEIRQERALALRCCVDGTFEIETSAGVYGTLAAIVATGCRLGHPGESRLFHRKRILWFWSNEVLDHLVGQMKADQHVHTVCLCGAEGVGATRRRIGATGALQLRTYAEPPYSQPPSAGVERGRLVHLGVGPYDSRLTLRFERPDGSTDEFDADIMLVDFNAYEATATTIGFLHADVRKQPNGYVHPDRSMATGTPGLFSAGDVNGAPFCVATAISEGTIAGFSAYAYACFQRTGEMPNLFPFYPYEI